MMNDTLQAQLIATRRNHILDAAAQVFAEKGFHATTIKDIAKVAGVADGTLYNYFENKTALLMGILERMQEQAIQQAPPLPPPPGDLRGMLRLYLQVALQQQDSALFRILLSEMMVNPELRARYQQIILEPTLHMAEALFTAQGVPPERVRLLVRAVSGMVMGLLIQAQLGDTVVLAEWEALPGRLADLLVDGVGTQGTQA
jgi:TetR/AcrR family fatty acid metabolism transcriptional regulator